MRMFRIQWWGLLAFIVVLVAVVTQYLIAEHTAREREERRHLANLSNITADIVQRQLQATDRLLQSCIDDFPDWQAAGKNWAEASKDIAQRAALGHGTEILMLQGVDGTVLASNRQDLVGQNFSHRYYFYAARDSRDGSARIISPPFTTVYGVFSVTVSRKLTDRAGNFAGVVMASLDMPFIGRVLERTLYAPDMWTAVAHGEGAQIAMIPERPGQLGMNLAVPGSFFTRHMESGESENVLTGVVAATGENRMMALRTIQPAQLNMNFPLVIAVGREIDAIYADWRQRVLIWALTIVGVVILLVFGLRSYQRRLRSEWRTVLRKQALVDTATDGIHLLDAEGRLRDANPAFLALLGLAPTVIGEAGVEDFDAGASLQEIASSLRELLDSGETRVFESRYRHCDGHLIDVEVSCRPLFLEGEAVLVASARDITERKKSERELAKLHQAVEQSPEGICITDADGTIEYVNRAFAENSGYAVGELIGRNPRILHSGQTPEAVYQSLWSSIQAGKVWVGELTNRRKDGSLYIESEIISPVRQADGTISHYLALKQDITQKKRLEGELDAYRQGLEAMVEAKTGELQVANESLAQSRDAANLAARSKAAFLSNMSHEIRTPMNGIIGMLHLLRRTKLEKRQDDYLGRIEHSANHLLALINDILDLSKIDAGKLNIDCQPVLMSQVMANLRSIVGGMALDKGLVLHVPPPELPAGLLGDATRIMQALLNYASNAVKYSEKGRIEIRTRLVEETESDCLVRFEVEDTGIGIAPKAMERLFQAFEQADNSMTRSYAGTGLGLAITRQLARLMGGDAGASSVPGVGSTFWFSVRLKKGGAETPEMQEVSEGDAELQLKAHHAGRHVLLVEDDPINQEISSLLLEDVGLVPCLANNGQEAVDLASQGDFALILMDMQMPVMDGLAATRAIRRISRYRETPILALTANAFSEDREHCLAAGMNDFIAKPVNPDILFRKLLEWLAAGRAA